MLSQLVQGLPAPEEELATLRDGVQHLEAAAEELARLQQRKQQLAGTPQQLLQLRREVDVLQQEADATQQQQQQQVRWLHPRALFAAARNMHTYHLRQCVHAHHLRPCGRRRCHRHTYPHTHHLLHRVLTADRRHPGRPQPL